MAFDIPIDAQYEFELEVTSTLRPGLLSEVKESDEIEVIWERSEQRFSGDPATIVTLVSSFSGLLWLVNKIVSGWRHDVVVDTRKKGIIVTETLPSRRGHIIVIKSNGELETLSGPSSNDKLKALLPRNL